MTQIPDKAVQAAIEVAKLHLNNTGAVTSDQECMTAALTAALPHLAISAAPCSVEVRGLIWKDLDNGGSKCETDSKYSIDFWPREKMYVDAYTKMMRRKSLSEAKEAMQGQFERFFKPYIVTKPVDVAAVRDGAEEFAIDKLRFRAIHTNSDADRQAYFNAVSKWFQDRHLRALSPAEPVALPQDVISLIIAARELVYSDQVPVNSEKRNALDKAAEAFASRVPWENEPYEPAALPQLAISPAPCSVEVKKLSEWRRGYCDECVTIEQASTGLGSIYQVRVLNGVVWLDFPDERTIEFKTCEAAKAAAQADFDRRILSQIVTKPVDVAAVRRQAIALAERAGMDNANEADLFIEDLIATISRFTIRALSPAEPVDQWQDIATAPKGVSVLLLRNNGSIQIEDWQRFYQSNHPNFTHWLPLPAAPTSK